MGKQNGGRQRGATYDITSQLFSGGATGDLSIDSREQFVDEDESDVSTPASQRPSGTVARSSYAAPVGVLQRSVVPAQVRQGTQSMYNNNPGRDDGYQVARANLFEQNNGIAVAQQHPLPAGTTVVAQRPKRMVLLKKDAGQASDRDEFRR
ncbi:Hypothetical protein, putative [Bodo saltans]|uniref:Uncharacterized protein n=1 Tax=Bodo saltans TaxID=75058 RepID=A0A0S4JF83_BODSA|nr:Hypothetical protein, putative [Bodo saltans]|eukprot:CUG90250.1 Hypothetical protein, putative [Bodo saltans]